MKRDPELTNFENDLLESIAQAKRGDYARVHTPAMITARRGRPVGSVASTNKARLNMRLEADTLDALRATGKGWQTRLSTVITEAVRAGRI